MAETEDVMNDPEGAGSDDDEPAEKPKGVLSRFGLKVAQLGFSRDVLMNKVRIGDVEAVSTILADPRAISIGGANLVDGWGLRPVHYAAASGQLAMMKYLVDECGAAANPRTEENPESENFQVCEKRTPLHFAAINSHAPVCTFLADKLVNASLRDVHGHTPRFYAKDSDLKRFLKKAEESYFHLQFANKMLHEILTQKVGEARAPMVSEGGRVILTFKEMNKDIVRFNKKTGNDLPKHGIPGQSAVMRIIKMMNDPKLKDRVNGGILGIMNSSADPKYPMPVFCRFSYTTYIHQPTLWITEFFVTPGLRRDRNGQTLLLHTLLHAVQGGYQIKKAVAIVHDENYMARGFFESAGFSKEPAYRVVRKFRKPESQTYVCNDVPSACARLSTMLLKWLKVKDGMRAEEFKLSEVKDEEEQAKYAKKTAKDYDLMQQKLDLLYHPPLPRFMAPHLALQGGPLVDISNFPSKATSSGKRGVKEKEKGSAEEDESNETEWFTCDVDRVTQDMSNMYRSDIMRARNHSEWLNRKQNKTRGNSRLLNLQGAKMAEWMEHLDGLEDRGLPRGWTSFKDAGDNERVVYINMKTEERTIRRPVSHRTDAMRQASERQAIESKRKLGDQSRPRSATPGTLLIVKEPEYEGPGSTVAMERFPILELTGNKEEEETEERKRRAKLRVKFEKTFNRLIDTAQSNLIRLDQFQKVCYREWGHGSQDAETAIERARKILPPGPPPAKTEPVAKPADENQTSNDAGNAEAIEDGIHDLSSKRPNGGNGGQGSGKLQPKVSSIRATSASGDRQASSGKSIRFGNGDEGHEQVGSSSSSSQAVHARPNSATVSAGSFGAASSALFSTSDTRRQRIRSPQRGRAEPLSRSASPQRRMPFSPESGSGTASSDLLPTTSSVIAVSERRIRPMSRQVPAVAVRQTFSSIGLQVDGRIRPIFPLSSISAEVDGHRLQGKPAGHMSTQATSVAAAGSHTEGICPGHPGFTSRMAKADTVGSNVKIASHADQAAADWVAIASEREQALHDADSFLDMYAPPPRTKPAADVELPQSSPQASVDHLNNQDGLLQSLEQSSLFRRPSSGAAHAHIRSTLGRANKDSSRASSAAPSRPKTSASGISAAETRAASEYSRDFALESKVWPASDYSRPPSSHLSRAESAFSFGSDLDASRPTTAARDSSRPTTSASFRTSLSRPTTAASGKSTGDAALDEGGEHASGYELRKPGGAMQASPSLHPRDAQPPHLVTRHPTTRLQEVQSPHLVRPASAVPVPLPPLQEDFRASDASGPHRM